MRTLSRLFVILAVGASVRAQVDWRMSQSPVKDQGRRGTCAAFAICGALETFPGVPCDLSEQLLYATLKLHQNDVGAWMRHFGETWELDEGDLFHAYVGLFSRLGTCAEAFLPYDPDPKRAAPEVPEDLKRYLELAHVPPEALDRLRSDYGKYGFDADDCTLLDTAAVHDIERLKSLLTSGVLAIPVGYAVNGPNWSNLKETGNVGPDGRRLFVHPGLMEQFSKDGTDWLDYNDAKLACMRSGEDLVEGIEQGRWQRRAIGKKDDYGGHAVLLVGFDDRGFLAKNSWGTTWGDAGYFRVAWDYHRLYAGQGLLLSRARIRNPALSPFETRKRIESGRFRVKLQPRGSGDDEHWSLSTWMLEPRDAAYERVEYTVEGLGADGAWRTLLTEVADAGSTEERNGAAVELAGPALTAVRKSSKLRIALRIGVRASVHADEIGANTWMRRLSFAAIEPSRVTGAIDLQPED